MKLLIVDDEIRAVQALVKRVNWQEYDFEPPLAAYSMAQAQGVFQQQEIYLMLCDIEMPQGSGLELFEWVKTYYPLTECIFVTCHDEYSYLRSAMQLGSCDYLLKPINYTLLQEALKMWWSASSGAKINRRGRQSSPKTVCFRRTRLMCPIRISASCCMCFRSGSRRICPFRNWQTVCT